jgi:hypothetical protein
MMKYCVVCCLVSIVVEATISVVAPSLYFAGLVFESCHSALLSFVCAGSKKERASGLVSSSRLSEKAHVKNVLESEECPVE